MITKFTINAEIFRGKGSLKQSFKIFEESYKCYGWELDKETEDVFIIINHEINLSEGDRVNINGIRIVDWKCTNVLDGIIEYALVEE